MPSEGASGGLISVWNDDILKMEDVLKNQRVLAIKFSCVRGGFTWIGANVYGPNDDSKREDFWASISDMLFQWPEPWCIGGDFNVVRFSYEKKGGRRITQCMENFSEFINRNELIDKPMVGRKYTWSNNQERAAMSRLDRFLVSKEWDEYFKDAIQSALNRYVSDQSPIKFGLNIVGFFIRIF